MAELLATVTSAVVLLGNAIVAGAFAASAFPKLRDPDGSALAILDYRLVPSVAVSVLAVALPVAQLIAAIGLLLLFRWASVLGLLVLALYTAAMLTALVRRLDIECHCGGRGDRVGAMSLARNTLLACALLPGLALSQVALEIPSSLLAGCGAAGLLAAFVVPHLRLHGRTA